MKTKMKPIVRGCNLILFLFANNTGLELRSLFVSTKNKSNASFVDSDGCVPEEERFHATVMQTLGRVTKRTRPAYHM